MIHFELVYAYISNDELSLIYLPSRIAVYM